MTDNEHLFRIKQLADTKQLPLLDEQEFLKFQLDSREELTLDEDGITVYIPINFDADKAFGLDVCQTTNEDYINLYAQWQTGDKSSLGLNITYCNNSSLDGDFYLKVPLDERQQKVAYARLEEQCREVYGKTADELWKEQTAQDKPFHMSKEQFWKIIDRVRSKADISDSCSMRDQLYRELIRLTQDEMLGFDCIWQCYRNLADSPLLFGAACIINGGSSDDRFADFKNWLILQGQEVYSKAVANPDSLANTAIPFDDTEWENSGNVPSYAYAGQLLHGYFEDEGISDKLRRKYPDLLKTDGALDEPIMQALFPPAHEKEQGFDRYLLAHEIRHYIRESGLEYSYDTFYQECAPDKAAWGSLQKSLATDIQKQEVKLSSANLPELLPNLSHKRKEWDVAHSTRNRNASWER